MAVINGSFADNSKNLQPYIDYSYTQNTDAVTTTVTAKLYVKKLTSYGNTYNSSTPYSLSIGGTVVASGSKSVNMSSVSTGSSVLVASGSRTLSHTSTGTLSATLSGVVDWSGLNPGRGTVSGSVTFPTIVVNTPPSMSGSLSISPSGTIAENVSTINLSWTKASDSQGNANKYQIERYVNGTKDKTISISSISTTSYSDTTVGSFGQGTKIYYKIKAGDSYGEWSGYLTSSTVTKNTMTGAALASSSSITSSFPSLSFTWSGASNTNGNTTFTYDLTANGVTIYNATGLTGSSLSVAIVTSAPSSGAYILRSDLINKFKSSNFNGSLAFTLKTKNNYGSSKDSIKTISVDMRATPTAGRPTISENQTYSTAYKTVTSTGNKYFLPNGTDKIRVDWTAGSDILGQAITYDVQYKIGSGGFITAGSNISNIYYDLILPKQTLSQSIVVRVVTKTSYGYTSSYDSPAKTLHYYNAPSIELIDISRTETTASAIVALRNNTSIPNVNFTARYTGVSTGTLTNTTSNQTISATGLSGGKTYTWTVYVKDSAFTSTEVSLAIKVPTYTPLFSVREKGVGVNAIPNGYAEFMVGGKISANNIDARETIPANADLNNYMTNGFYVSDSDGNSTTISNRPPGTVGFSLDVYNVWGSGAAGRQIQIATLRKPCIQYMRWKSESEAWSSWKKSYTEDAKPTPSEIGAAAANTLANGYEGMTLNNGTTSGWIRTTVSGIIPYQSGGASALGTSSWPFNSIYGQAIYEGGTALSSKYSLSSHSHSAYEVGAYARSEWSSSKGANGYCKLPNGVIFQWGTTTITPSAADTVTSKDITFPIAFPSACRCVQVSAATTVPNRVTQGFSGDTTTGFSIYMTRTNTTNTIYDWFAVGY